MLSTETRAPSALHPLEPLSKSEMELATAILKADARVPIPDRAHRFVTVDKSCSAKAFSTRRREGAKGLLLYFASLRLQSFASRALNPWSPWLFGVAYDTDPPEDAGRRLSRALVWVRPLWFSGPPNPTIGNAYARPVQNLPIIPLWVVDLNVMEVVRVEDYGPASSWPLPPEPGNWTRNHIHETRTDLKPLEVVQDEGPSFSVDGHLVKWQNWRFRIGFTPREGVALGYQHPMRTAGSYRKGAKARRGLYYSPGVFASSRLRVSYWALWGGPEETGFRKNAFDIGEFGPQSLHEALWGLLANSLTLGCDCLGHIRYFDAHMTDSAGRISTIENAIRLSRQPTMREEDDGILWKHTDWRTGPMAFWEVRRSRRLVVSFISPSAIGVGNYEYAFYWNFYQDGSLELEVKLTGIANTTAVNPGEKTAHGVEIAPQHHQPWAPTRQHIFNARLDMSVDGQNNSVYEVNSTRTPRPKAARGNPHGNAFTPAAPESHWGRSLFESELDAGRLCNLAQSPSGRYWRIANDSVPNRLGDAVGYRLLPGENCIPFADDDAAIIRRAGFLTKHLWVTPHQERERYAAGDYPNQRLDGDGLPEWTAADRRVADTDVVVWYTFGHTHIPRPEDWPVMPAHKMGFMLRPDGFFDRNPALDLPPSPESHPCAPHGASGGASCDCGHSPNPIGNGPKPGLGCHC